MKPKNGSYPYLRIAKRFGLDYGDVLLSADHIAHPERSVVAYQSPARLRIAEKLSEKDYFDFYKVMEATVEEFEIIRKEGWD